MLSSLKALSKHRVASVFSMCKCRESTVSTSQYALFIDKDVQNMLRSLSRFEMEKVFQEKPMGAPLRPPKYKLLTTEELKEEEKRTRRKFERLCQMPPVLPPRQDVLEVLSEDPSLDGFDEHHSKLIFTDISFQLKYHERQIVVREPNGLLRKAFQEERNRMNQIYYPVKRKHLHTPKLFEDENLNSLLDREEYKFVLDLASLQFEPYEPIYHKITTKTYDRVNEKGHFQKLISTRHYGSLTFYLVLHKNIDKMLIEAIQSERMRDAYLLIRLYHRVHPTCESAVSETKSIRTKLENYIKYDSKEREVLELALQTYLAKKVQVEAQAKAS